MKYIYNIALTVFIAMGVLTSCESEGMKIQNGISISEKIPLENLKGDARILEYLSVNKKIIQGIKNAHKVQELSSKEELSNSELEKFSLALGFNSFEDYKLYYKRQTNLLRNLEKDYGLSGYTETEIYKALFYEKENYLLRLDPCSNSCDRSFKNCMGLTTTTALAAHAACIALDPSIVGGIICHGLALAAQYFAQDECSNQLSICLRDCRALVHQY